MKKILTFIPNYTDATSFYRGSGPLKALQKNGVAQFVKGTECNWEILKEYDAVFLQRPFTDAHVQIVNMAQANGKPIWVDYDDDLFNVPRSNRTYKIYGSQKHQNNVAQIIAKANLISVSTQALKTHFTELLAHISKAAAEHAIITDPNKVIVVPNAYDEGFVAHYRPKELKRHQNKLITWRGSDTHDKDLMSVTGALKNAVSRHLDWTYNFIGSPFWFTIEELSTIPKIKETNIIETESLDPAEYFYMLYQTAPALMIVPLWDCPFNRAKSNIAWIEGIHAGACSIAPDWDEWQRPGVMNYRTPKQFETTLDHFMRGEIDGQRLAKDGWQFIMDALTLEKINHKRKTIIESL